jgi:LysR family transcriptional activator of glutamate synthase operon
MTAAADPGYDGGMSLEQITTFVTVARTGSVMRAASELHLTQPPLSRRIRSLEDELDVKLFVREARGMRLTEAGRQFLPHAEAVLRALEDGVRSLRD